MLEKLQTVGYWVLLVLMVLFIIRFIFGMIDWIKLMDTTKYKISIAMDESIEGKIARKVWIELVYAIACALIWWIIKK